MAVLFLSQGDSPSALGWEMWVGSQHSSFAHCPALAHSETAVLVCRGMARRMQDSDGWEMARGAARMIHSNTDGQSGSSKVKGRERVNKSLNSLISDKCPTESHRTEVLHEMMLHEMVLQHARTAPSSSGFRGTRHPCPQWVTGSWFLPGRTLGSALIPATLSPLHTTKDAELGKHWATPVSQSPAGAVGPCGGLIPGGHDPPASKRHQVPSAASLLCSLPPARPYHHHSLSK